MCFNLPYINNNKEVMETIGMRNDHANFEKDLDVLKYNLIRNNEMEYSSGYLMSIIYNLEKRIRELEFKINQK